jgi:ribosomal protein S18 acetylase RimI-like enzyme
MDFMPNASKEMLTMSLYAQYIFEREGFSTIECPGGFATYRTQGSECYLRDIYVAPEARKSGLASELTRAVERSAKDAGATILTGTVDPKAKGSSEGLAAMLAYGFKLHSSTADRIVVFKDLK